MFLLLHSLTVDYGYRVECRKLMGMNVTSFTAYSHASAQQGWFYEGYMGLQNKSDVLFLGFAKYVKFK